MSKKDILFLNVDGVLNNNNTSFERNRDDDCICIEGNWFSKESFEVLREVVEYFDFKIVLFSTWKYYLYYENIKKIALKRVFELYGIKIFDTTPSVSTNYTNSLGFKGNEINQWLLNNKGEYGNFLILDTTREDGILGKRLVPINSVVGLKRSCIKIIEEKLCY